MNSACKVCVLNVGSVKYAIKPLSKLLTIILSVVKPVLIDAMPLSTPLYMNQMCILKNF